MSSTSTNNNDLAFDELYQIPFERNFKKWEECWTPALRNEWAHAIRQELVWMQKQRLMRPNETQFSTLKFSKPHIYEVDLHETQLRQKVPELEALFLEGADRLKQLINNNDTNWNLVPGPSGHTVKLQYNEGSGGCFPFHYDNPGKPNRRKLTCLLYLNPNWVNGHGGELEFQPFLQPTVTIPPLMDRLVIFQSDLMLHRVKPSLTSSRYCLTFWLDGASVNTPAESNLTTSDLKDWPKFVEKVRYTPLQRAISRGVYADEYLVSLTDCMKQNVEGYRMMLLAHEKHLEAVEKNPVLRNIIQQLIALRQDHH